MNILKKIVLGLVIFNAWLIILAPIFPSGTTGISDSATDPDDLATNPRSDQDTQSRQFGDINNLGVVIIGMLVSPVSLGIIGLFVALSGGIGHVFGGAKNIPIAIGIGMFLGIITSLWVATSHVISNVDPTNNPYVSGLLTLIPVVIGIIVVYRVSEMFASQQEAY